MLWRTSVKGEIVSVVDKWFLVLLILADFLSVQFAQDLVEGPSGEIWAEDGGFILRVSCGSVSFVSSLQSSLRRLVSQLSIPCSRELI